MYVVPHARDVDFGPLQTTPGFPLMPRPIRRHGPHGIGSPRRAVVLPRVELEIARGRARNAVRSIDGLAYLIGAADDNDLVLADPQFPESHSYLLRSPLGLTLCWLGEGPEITIDGQPVLSAASVPDGARLRTGPYEFRVRLTWPAAHETTVVATNDATDGDFPRSISRPEIVTVDFADRSGGDDSRRSAFWGVR